MKTMRLALLAAALLSTACAGAPLRAGADMEPTYDFTQYTSFAWDEPDERPIGDPRLDSNPFFIRRLRAAIHWELATRGFGYEPKAPGLVVHHHAVVRDRVKVLDDYQNAYELAPGLQMIQYQEGTFLVDIADARTNEVVWRGWAQLDLGNALENPEALPDQVNAAIEMMFESFPLPRGRVQSTPTEGR